MIQCKCGSSFVRACDHAQHKLFFKNGLGLNPDDHKSVCSGCYKDIDHSDIENIKVITVKSVIVSVFCKKCKDLSLLDFEEVENLPIEERKVAYRVISSINEARIIQSYINDRKRKTKGE